MPFIPHTEAEVQSMLATIGVDSIESLFAEIPPQLQANVLDELPSGMNEMELARFFKQRLQQDVLAMNFIGAGAYEHHIPSAVWQLASRGEFMTAYTPYQGEASQGMLQLIYEFQTMLTQITAMEVANASLYGGASALAEAVLMAVRCQQKNNGRKILMPKQCHPHYQAVTRNIVAQQNIRLQEYGYDKDSGQTDLQALKDCHCEGVAAIVIQQPNFFGIIEDVDAIVQWAEENNLLIIAVANPMFLSVLKPPGEWANSGVDIACGDVQPFGIPLTSGGPYCGYLCARKKHLRQMPGRIVGRTVDTQGREGYTLTLQAREQHIRRSKARSNICTNQGLLVVAATIYLSIMGPQGIRRVAEQCYQRTRELVTKLTAIDGVKKTFSGAYFGDCALQLPKDINHILDVLAEQGFAAGYALGQHYCDLDQSMLVAATETKTHKDMEIFAAVLEKCLIGD